MDNVIPGLYIGGITCANDDKLIKGNFITHIVSCQPAYVHDNITYYNIHVDDDETVDLYSHFYNAVDFIDDALSKNGNVLVHCYAGISRSASIVLAYLMAIKKYTLDDALELLVNKRRICDPNPGFMLQLKCFEWALSLMPKTYVTTNDVCKGPVFNGIQFDFANYEVLFCEDLESMYDGCIFIDRCHMPQFRPVITSNIIYNYCKGYCDEIYQLDVLEPWGADLLYIPTLLRESITHTSLSETERRECTSNWDSAEHLSQDCKSTEKPTPRRILIVSTNDNILVLAYWNLLYRSGMSYEESFKYFKQNASIELNNAFDCNSRTILYPYNTPHEKIIETQLARLKKCEEDGDKKFMSGHLKYHVKSIKAFINVICHYFIPEIQEYKNEILAKLDRQMTMCV